MLVLADFLAIDSATESSIPHHRAPPRLGRSSLRAERHSHRRVAILDNARDGLAPLTEYQNMKR